METKMLMELQEKEDNKGTPIPPEQSIDSEAEQLLRIMVSKCTEKGIKQHQVVIHVSEIPATFSHTIPAILKSLKEKRFISSYSEISQTEWKVLIAHRGLSFVKIKTTKGGTTPPFFVEKKYDVFISHSHKDKLSYVNQLYHALKRLEISIYYDASVSSWGDNWKEKMLEGVNESRFAIIVISKHFFDATWTEWELRRFFERQYSTGQKIILPLLYGVTLEEFKQKYPFLENIEVVDSKTNTTDEITILFAQKLIKRLQQKE